MRAKQWPTRSLGNGRLYPNTVHASHAETTASGRLEFRVYTTYAYETFDEFLPPEMARTDTGTAFGRNFEHRGGAHLSHLGRVYTIAFSSAIFFLAEGNSSCEWPEFADFSSS